MRITRVTIWLIGEVLLTLQVLAFHSTMSLWNPWNAEGCGAKQWFRVGFVEGVPEPLSRKLYPLNEYIYPKPRVNLQVGGACNGRGAKDCRQIFRRILRKTVRCMPQLTHMHLFFFCQQAQLVCMRLFAHGLAMPSVSKVLVVSCYRLGLVGVEVAR